MRAANAAQAPGDATPIDGTGGTMNGYPSRLDR